MPHAVRPSAVITSDQALFVNRIQPLCKCSSISSMREAVLCLRPCHSSLVRCIQHQSQQLPMQVQHAGLRDSFAADAFTVDVLVRLVQWLYPDFNYKWLVHEVKHSLPKVSISHLAKWRGPEKCVLSSLHQNSPERSLPHGGRLHVSRLGEKCGKYNQQMATSSFLLASYFLFVLSSSFLLCFLFAFPSSSFLLFHIFQG